MPDPNTADTVREAIEKANARTAPTGESPPLPETEETDEKEPDEISSGKNGPESDEAELAGDVAGDRSDEDASGSPEGEGSHSSPAAAMADAETAEAIALEAIEEIEAAGIPTLDTDHELAAYWNGYRAGGDDPGYLLTLAELRRHLGSFFEPEEEEAFNALSGDDFWSRWMLGYLDAAAGRMARPETPRKAEDMDW